MMAISLAASYYCSGCVHDSAIVRKSDDTERARPPCVSVILWCVLSPFRMNAGAGARICRASVLGI